MGDRGLGLSLVSPNCSGLPRLIDHTVEGVDNVFSRMGEREGPVALCRAPGEGIVSG